MFAEHLEMPLTGSEIVTHTNYSEHSLRYSLRLMTITHARQAHFKVALLPVINVSAISVSFLGSTALGNSIYFNSTQ